jgi:hypothetical protein
MGPALRGGGGHAVRGRGTGSAPTPRSTRRAGMGASRNSCQGSGRSTRPGRRDEACARGAQRGLLRRRDGATDGATVRVSTPEARRHAGSALLSHHPGRVEAAPDEAARRTATSLRRGSCVSRRPCTHGDSRLALSYAQNEKLEMRSIPKNGLKRWVRLVHVDGAERLSVCPR